MTLKRVLLFLVIVVSLVAIVSIASAETYTVNPDIDKLNIRSQYDSSIILGGIRGGRTIEIDYHDKYWGYFVYDGIPAKVYMDYLVPASGTTTPATPTTSHKSSSSPKKEESPTYVSEDEATLIYYVSEKIQSHINVRNKKSESGKVIGRLDPGDEVLVIKMGKTWTRIVYNNQLGFVYTKYLVDLGANLPDEGELYKVKVKNNTTVNVREEDTKKSKVITTLRNGAFVKVFDQQETWSFVYYSYEDFGYIMNKFLVKVE